MIFLNFCSTCCLIFLSCDRETVSSAWRILLEFWPEEQNVFRSFSKFKISDATKQKTQMALSFLRNSSKMSIPSASLSMNSDVVDPSMSFYLDFILISIWLFFNLDKIRIKSGESVFSNLIQILSRVYPDFCEFLKHQDKIKIKLG